MFDSNGNDLGYKESPTWWWDKDDPDRFRIENLDSDYPPQYFPLAKPTDEVLSAMTNYILQYFHQFAGRKPKSYPNRGIIDVGCGGGWLLIEFEKNHGITGDGIEGSYEGFLMGADRSDYEFGIQQADLRMPREQLAAKYDIAICTEVAEHLAPYFSGILIHNLVGLSDFIWWSSEGPEIQNKSHLHHVNEQPIEYWQAIFKWHGYECFILPDDVFNACAGRGRCVFYNKNVYQL